MNTLTIILIALAIVLLISNITIFTIEHTTKQELNFDKSKVKIVLFASEDEDELAKSEVAVSKKYCVLDSTAGYLKAEHGYIYIKAYPVDKNNVGNSSTRLS